MRRLLTAFGYRSEMVSTSAGRVHVWSAPGRGRLPPVVVLHGLGSASINWIPILESLRPHVHQVFAVDLPGHGFSERPTAFTNEVLQRGVVEGLDGAGHPPALVIGHSLGGAGALRYVNARPERVRGLLLFSPAGAPLAADELAAVRSIFSVDTTADAVRFLRTLHARPAELKARIAAPFVRASLRDPALREWLGTVPPFDPSTPDAVYLTPAEVAEVRGPLRVVWGREDRILPASALAFWRTHLPPHGDLIEPAHVGHTPFLDDRAWTARAIRSFAETLR